MAVRAGYLTALYLFDVAEEADLAALPGLLQAQAAPARLAPKPITPASVQYQQPPIVIDGEALGLTAHADVPAEAAVAVSAAAGAGAPAGKMAVAAGGASADAVGLGARTGQSAGDGAGGLRVRVKVFDYGVISLALSCPVSGSWEALAAEGQRLGALEAQAQAWCEQVRQQLASCLVKSRPPRLSEDYLIYTVTELEEPRSAEALLARDGAAIAALLRGEREPLSPQERDEVLRHRISYLVDDLVVPTWNAAFVYDTDAGAQAAIEIFEFANSQLLQFRYYDDLLDSELGRIYDSLEDPRWYDGLAGRRYVRAAQQLHALFIDVNELTDKTENALKMVGDVYAARLYALVAARLGLDRWKQNVEEKLDTLDDIYRFSVDQTQMSRGHLLELTIILILVLELVLFFMGIMN